MASRGTVTWQGMAEFQALMRRLPDDLAVQVRREGEAAANGAAFAIRSAYGAHRRTGNLQESVVVEEQRMAVGFRFRVRTKGKKAAHAHLIEFGTKARHYITEGGVRHETGAGRAYHIFLPRIAKHKRQMFENIIALLVRQGWRVTGDARTA